MATKKSRKNPRAQVALLARYRSPTVFEFVNEECFDLSAGGMFIKSEAPAPVGTLLKLECVVDNGADTLRGVARVVWLRERESEGQPAGMGVKFVKLEPGSREIIHRILVERGSIVPEAPVASDPPGAPLSRPPSIVPIKLAIGANGAGPAHVEPAHAEAHTRASASQPAREVDAASALHSSIGTAPTLRGGTSDIAPVLRGGASDTAPALRGGASDTAPALRGGASLLTPLSAFSSSPPPAASAAASEALSSEPPTPRVTAPMAVLLAAGAQPAIAREPKAVDSARPASAKRPSARPIARKPAPAPARPSQRGPALAVLGLGVVAFVGAIAFALSQPKATPSPVVTREVPRPSAAAPAPIVAPPQAPEPPAAEPEVPAPAPPVAAAIAPEPTPVPAPTTATATPEPARHERPAAEPTDEEHEHHHHGHEADTAATQALNEQLAREAAAANAPAAGVATAVPAVPAAPTAAGPAAAPAAPATPAANPAALEAAATAQSNVSATAEAARPAAPTSYVLQVVTTPGGAQVTAAGQSGVSPCSLELGTLDGPVEVRASLAGYTPASASIDRIGFMLDDGRMRRRISLSLQELPKPLPEPEPVAKTPHHHSHAAAAASASPAVAADKPASPAASSASPMETAMKCLTAGNNACVVNALEGKTRSAQELELLIETYRTLGNTRKAEAWMQTYVDKYPTERRAATYRRQLERRQAESTATP